MAMLLMLLFVMMSLFMFVFYCNDTFVVTVIIGANQLFCRHCRFFTATAAVAVDM
jgi:hypothetical protein